MFPYSACLVPAVCLFKAIVLAVGCVSVQLHVRISACVCVPDEAPHIKAGPWKVALDDKITVASPLPQVLLGDARDIHQPSSSPSPSLRALTYKPSPLQHQHPERSIDMPRVLTCLKTCSSFHLLH